MTYTEQAKTIDGVDFTGYVSGTTNPTVSDGVLSGAGLIFTAPSYGELTVYMEVGAGKTLKICDSDNNTIKELKSEEKVQTSLTAEVEAGKTYYAYVSGSKARMYGAVFNEKDAPQTSTPTDETKPTATPSQTSTPEATESPDQTSKPEATDTPSQTGEPSSTEKPNEQPVSIELINNGEAVTALASGDSELVGTIENAAGKDIYAVQYDENGRMIAVTKMAAQESFGFNVTIKEETTTFTALVWEGNKAVSEAFKIAR